MYIKMNNFHDFGMDRKFTFAICLMKRWHREAKTKKKVFSLCCHWNGKHENCPWHKRNWWIEGMGIDLFSVNMQVCMECVHLRNVRWKITIWIKWNYLSNFFNFLLQNCDMLLISSNHSSMTIKEHAFKLIWFDQLKKDLN